MAHMLFLSVACAIVNMCSPGMFRAATNGANDVFNLVPLECRVAQFISPTTCPHESLISL